LTLASRLPLVGNKVVGDAAWLICVQQHDRRTSGRKKKLGAGAGAGAGAQ